MTTETTIIPEPYDSFRKAMLLVYEIITKGYS